MYRLIVLIGLVFVCLGSWISGILGIERKTEVKTAPVNGSLSAVDALGRETVSAGESDKKVGVFYFLGNGEHNLDGPYDVPKICVFTTGEYDHNVLSRERIREICTAKCISPLAKTAFWRFWAKTATSAATDRSIK